MGRVIGIDLGTTNSVVAIVDMEGSRILYNREGETQTRSAVGLYKGEFLLGTPAIKKWPLAPKDTIISIKRLMGRAISDQEIDTIKKKKWVLYDIVEPSDGTKDSVRVKLGGKEYSPIEISAIILRKLKKDAEYVLGEEVTHAVITTPAYFSDKQKLATREAGLQAGLTVMKILDEPTAAAIAYGIESKEEVAKTILVYDLGGGTFDISVLMMAAGTFAPLNLEGDMWLGGDDFDQVIVDDAVDYVKKEHGIDPTDNFRFMATLKGEAQKAKETLSSVTKTALFVQGILHDSKGNIIDVEMEITREHFENRIRPLVAKTVILTIKAVEEANLTLEDIDLVLMAGNGTLVPMVQNAMEQLFGKEKVRRRVHPKECVALGAAITATVQIIICPKCGHENAFDSTECETCGEPLAGVTEKITCSKCNTKNEKDAECCANCGYHFVTIGNIAPFNYGIQSAEDKFHVYIHKNDPFPTPEEKHMVKIFYTRFANQRIVCYPVWGGDHLDSVSKNAKQGEVFAVLPPNCPEGMPINIKLWLDKDGIFILNSFLEDGKDLNDLIGRGETDQKAMEVFMMAEAEIAGKRDTLKPAEIEEAQDHREKALKKIDQKDWAEAVKEAEAYLKIVEEGGMIDDPLRDAVQRKIGYGKYIVDQYGWLIDKSAYHLNNLMGELQKALEKNDRDRMQKLLDELSAEINKLIETRDASGALDYTLLGVLELYHSAIQFRIGDSDPVKANNLRAELYDIERAYKERQHDARRRLDAFIVKANKALDEAPELPGEGVKCEKCGHLNPLNIRYCRECGFDLWIPRAERSRTPSTGDILKR